MATARARGATITGLKSDALNSCIRSLCGLHRYTESMTDALLGLSIASKETAEGISSFHGTVQRSRAGCRRRRDPEIR